MTCPECYARPQDEHHMVCSQGRERALPTDPAGIAKWIRQKDTCYAFSLIATAIETGDMVEARKLANTYKGWLSTIEIEAFACFGLFPLK